MHICTYACMHACMHVCTYACVHHHSAPSRQQRLQSSSVYGSGSPRLLDGIGLKELDPTHRRRLLQNHIVHPCAFRRLSCCSSSSLLLSEHAVGACRRSMPSEHAVGACCPAPANEPSMPSICHVLCLRGAARWVTVMLLGVELMSEYHSSRSTSA